MTSTRDEPARLVWRTSSYSSGNGQCVEISCRGSHVAVRDSKHPGPVLWFGAVAFTALARLEP